MNLFAIRHLATGFIRQPLLAASFAVVLGGCATYAEIPPGTPISQVKAQMGSPTLACPLPNGGQRLVWSGQPFGQFAWGTNVDSAGRIDQIQPLLTDRHFKVLSEGQWTPEQVTCEFGPPAEKAGVGLPSNIQIVWSYRYLQDGVWNSLMHVYFGTTGEFVTRHHPGPDPLYERERFPFLF